MRVKLAIITIAFLLLVAINVSAYGILHFRLQRMMWEAVVRTDAVTIGHMFAREDVDKGKARLYVLSTDEREDGNTGKHEGPFELWTWPTGRDTPTRIHSQAFVDSYNSTMKRLTKEKGDGGK